MEDEDNKPSSFHGTLSRFAYVPPSPSFLPSLRRTPDKVARQQNGVQSCDGLDGGDMSLANCAPTVAKSRKRKGERLGSGSRSPTPKKPRAAGEAYSHLNAVPDHIMEDLDVLFCGINPSYTSAERGHHYANPTNHFWPCLYFSGFTPRLLLASEDSTLPEKYNLGLTNLVHRPSASEAELSRQEMTNAVPTLLAKISRFRPRIICFVGKGIWLHAERSLRLRTSDDAGACAPHPNEAGVMLKEEFGLLIECAPVCGNMRVPKPEPELVGFGDANSATRGAQDAPLRQILTVQKAEKVPRATPSPSLPSTTGCDRVSTRDAALRKKAAASGPTFAYGLQHYKAVHDVEPNKSCVRETLFCVFPSTSGRVVSHQRDDKVLLFKALRENLERVKAGTLNTGSMQAVRLSYMGNTEGSS